MQCPKCGCDTKVTNTARGCDCYPYVIRERTCTNSKCKERGYTIERYTDTNVGRKELNFLRTQQKHENSDYSLGYAMVKKLKNLK